MGGSEVTNGPRPNMRAGSTLKRGRSHGECAEEHVAFPAWSGRVFRNTGGVVSAVPVLVVLLVASWFAILWWRLRTPKSQ